MTPGHPVISRPPPAGSAMLTGATAVRGDVALAAARTMQAFMVRRAVQAGDYPAGQGGWLATALDAMALRLLVGPVPSTTSGTVSLDRTLCRFIAVILSRRGPDVHDYLAPVLTYGPQQLFGSLHRCGRRLLRMDLSVHWITAAKRQLYVCERCGIVANQPAGLPPGEALRCDTEGVAFRLASDSGCGWYTGSPQPIGGHPERPLPVRPIPTGGTVIAPRLKADSAGLRRTAVAIVRYGDYQIWQHPLEIL